MRTSGNIAAIAADPVDGADLIALTRQRLKELDRLRHLGFAQLDRLNAATLALPQDQLFARMTGAKGNMAEFDRFARSIRQITVLEFELRGLFKAPDRDAPRKLRLVKSDRPDFEPFDYDDLFGDLNDYNDREYDEFRLRSDYGTGPLEDVVAGIRDILGAEPPPNDPFAPRAGRKPAENAAVSVTPPSPAAPPRGPEYYMRARPAEPEPVGPQTTPSMKAAELVIKTLAGKGFRSPSKAAMKKLRQGRGPPK